MKIIHKVEFVSLFYSIPIVNLQFIKGKAWRNSRAHSQCNETQQTTRKITYRTSFVYLCHAYLKHVDWYICKSLILLSFFCLPGNAARLTQANRYQTSVPQPCNEPAWVYWWTPFLRKNFLYEKIEAQLTERKFKKTTTTNIKSQTWQPLHSFKVFRYRNLSCSSHLWSDFRITWKNGCGKCSLLVLSANGWKDQNMDSSFSRQRKP